MENIRDIVNVINDLTTTDKREDGEKMGGRVSMMIYNISE